MKYLIYAMCALLLGCSTQKKLDKAKQRVLTSEVTFNAVGDTWQKLHPCATDTTYFLSSGDTLLLIDTFYNVKFDTISTPDNKTVIKTKTVNKTLKITDTLVRVVVDNRALSIANDTITSYKMKCYAAQENIMAAKDEAHYYKVRYHLWLFYFILLIVLIVTYKYLKSKYTLPFNL